MTYADDLRRGDLIVEPRESEAQQATEARATEFNEGPVKLSVNLAPDVAATLRELAKGRQTTLTEIVRQAIAVMKFMTDEQERGNRILVSEEDGRHERLREVFLL